MKKGICSFLILGIIILNSFCLGSCGTFKKNAEKIDGYEVIQMKDGLYLLGADDYKIDNGVLIIPSTIRDSPVVALGAAGLGLDRYETSIKMSKNDHIEKIVICHDIEIYPYAFANLSNLCVLEITCNLMSINEQNLSHLKNISLVTDNMSYFFAPLSFLKPHSITLRTEVLENIYSESAISSETISYDNLTAYFIHGTKTINATFERFTALSAFIVPESVTDISQNAFTNSNVDVFVRAERSRCPEGLQNGWDAGTNVSWGFKDEIVIFDSCGGTPISFAETQKNYLVVKKGELLKAPDPPLLEGHKFEGWYKDASYREEWDFEHDLVQESFYLIAKFTSK